MTLKLVKIDDWRGILSWLAFLLICLAPAGAPGQSNTGRWRSLVLRFSDKGTLKDVFDSGVRPYRFPRLERTTLEAKHLRITLVLKSGESLPEFPAEVIMITPLDTGLLSSIEMNRYRVSLDEARAWMLPYLGKGNRSPQEFDAFLAAVKNDYLSFDAIGRGRDNFVLQWRDLDGPRYALSFRKSFNKNYPLVPVISIDWALTRTPRQSRSFYSEPIPPPRGYENVAMQAPEKFGPDNQAEIEDSFRKSQDRLDASDASSETSLQVGFHSHGSLSPKTANETVETPSMSASKRRMWSAGILLLVIAGLLARYRFLRKR